jgi:hypothetical protein
MAEPTVVTLETITAEVVKLCRHVESLDKSVAKLADRIRQHGTAPFVRNFRSIPLPYPDGPPQTIAEAILRTAGPPGQCASSRCPT